MSRTDRDFRGLHPEWLLWIALVALLTLLAGQPEARGGPVSSETDSRSVVTEH